MRDILLVWASISTVCMLGAAFIGYRIRQNREREIEIDQSQMEGDLANAVRDINFGRAK